MPRKNLLSLHEAIVIALINQPSRTASFDEIANFIEERNLYTERKGNISLAKQVMLRSTKAKGAYTHLFEQLDKDRIRIREIQTETPNELKKENAELKELVKKLRFRQGIDKALLSIHGENAASVFADLLINPNPVSIHGTEKGIGIDFMISLNDIIAIESKQRIKVIYLKKPIIPVEGGRPRIKIETNENFDSLLKRLQGNGHHLLRVSDKYAINIYQYELSQKAKFILIPDLPKGLEEKLKTINTEKKFDRDLYHTRLMEIDRLSKSHKDFTINLMKIEEINRYKNL